MKLIRRAAIAAAAAVTVLAGLTSTATAAPKTDTGPQPIRCGMVVKSDARLYLAKDLRCAGFGIRVVSDQPADASTYPTVTIDLHGHTLRGDRNHDGITAFNGGNASQVTVSNGRLYGWRVGFGGDSNTDLARAVAAHNRVGYQCAGGNCTATRVAFDHNSWMGFRATSFALVDAADSAFTDNQIGVSLNFFVQLSVERGYFSGNQVGVVTGNLTSVSDTLFYRNQTAIKTSLAGDLGCSTQLFGITYIDNVRNIDGPSDAIC